MKKLMYLFVAGTIFVFTACNCGAGDAAATDAVEEVVACADDCQKACCLEGAGETAERDTTIATNSRNNLDSTEVEIEVEEKLGGE